MTDLAPASSLLRPARPALCGLAAVIALLVATSPALAEQQGLVRQHRLVHRFDFNETDARGQLLGQGHQWPPHWYAIGRPAGTNQPGFRRQPLHQELIRRPGHPRYTRLGYDDRHATVGQYSFHIGLDGGNAGAFLEVGTLPAVPGSDYLVTAEVRTEHLQLARGFLTAYFVDGNGRRIDASVESSRPLQTEGEWTTIAVKLTGHADRAAWIGLELALRQPLADPGHPLGAQQIVLQDVNGSIWFDNVSVWQVPHVSLGTQNAVNLIRLPERPEIESRVRDLSGSELIAELNVYDHRMRRVDGERFRVGRGAPMRWRWTPTLPALGWYLTELTVHDRERTAEGVTEQPVARTLGALLWLPRRASLHAQDRARFILPAEGMAADHWPHLPALLEATGIERTVISAWERGTARHDIEARVERIDELLQQLYGAAGEVAIALHPLPRELGEANDRDGERPIELFQAPAETWQPYLAPILMRHGPRVRRWALGDPAGATGVFHGNLPRALANVHEQLQRMAPRPHLIVPWRLDHARPEALERSPTPAELTLDIDVPPAIMPAELPAHLEPWAEVPFDTRLSLRTAPADRMPHARRVTDLALRMIHAWRAEPGALQLRRPWTEALHGEPGVLPDPLLGVFTNVARQLAGRRVVGELPLGDGLRGLILDGPAGGALVAWNTSGSAGEARMEMYLGEQPVVHDVWGNAARLPLEEGVHRVALERTPVFITGIDAPLALFRAGFRVEPAMIESLQVPHERTIELTNPWPRTVSGHLQILGPAGWQFQPARHAFSIPAGERITLPVRMQFPIAEVAGAKALRARFDFTADREYRIEMSAPMELGLRDVDFDATVALEPREDGGRDALVTSIIANRGEDTQALYVFANLVGHARQERLIARLAPGASVVRRFRFENAGDEVHAHGIRAGVRETAGPAILNYRLRPQLPPR